MLEIMAFILVGLVLFAFVCAIISGIRGKDSEKKFRKRLFTALLLLRNYAAPAVIVIAVIAGVVTAARFLLR